MGNEFCISFGKIVVTHTHAHNENKINSEIFIFFFHEKNRQIHNFENEIIQMNLYIVYIYFVFMQCLVSFVCLCRFNDDDDVHNKHNNEMEMSQGMTQNKKTVKLNEKKQIQKHDTFKKKEE